MLGRLRTIQKETIGTISNRLYAMLREPGQVMTMNM